MGEQQTMPVISVIVPVYHVEKELPGCLDSLLRQNYTGYEIVLVNDGGNEAETAICEEYAAAHPDRIVCFRQENAGLSAARNAGMARARGSWFMFADSDDRVHEDFCGRALAAAEGGGAQMAVFDLAYTAEDGRELSVHRSVLPEGVYPSAEVLKSRLTGGIPGYAWNKIYARELWDGIPFPVGELWEDDAVMHEVIDRAEKIAISHDVLYYKSGREGSITESAFRSAEGEKWVWIQRKKRYGYLKKTHPELLGIEEGVIAGAGLRYAFALAKQKGGTEEIRKVSRWLKEQGIAVRGGSLKKRLAYPLLLRAPGLFRLAAVFAPAGAGPERRY